MSTILLPTALTLEAGDLQNHKNLNGRKEMKRILLAVVIGLSMAAST
jgi:hypothetical protein